MRALMIVAFVLVLLFFGIFGGVGGGTGLLIAAVIIGAFAVVTHYRRRHRIGP